MNRFVLSGLRQKRPAGIAARWLQPLLLGLLAASASVHAIQPDLGTSKPKLSRAFLAPELQVQPELEASVVLGERSSSHPAAQNFLSRHPGTWEMRWDRRADRPNLIQGSGVPLIPGRGNSLSTASLGLRSGETVDMAVVEARLLDFIAENSDLLKTDGLEFQLDPQGSVAYGEGNTHWFIELAQSKNGVKVKGANLFFRISNGNIVQFGSNLV
ncbi:hypothetical protein, partial [Tahibacter aquaticus]|uniref:hypothetical protein n=1 Tax=Tahibacter aquaticus TaxID=520092 RepID=UPI0014153008